ncbi:MAG TPA: hypothetical protein VFB22_10120 [Candidatus Baltobacteraceae bacterium]|nr:hypothetical protein [Candidatus Baltobacteraceae bacterium]
MGLTVSSVPGVLAKIRTARDVALGTYFLRDGAVSDALLAAAKRGAHVRVSAQADPYGGAAGDPRAGDTARIAGELRDAGAAVTLFPREARGFHLKAAVCDGVAYLDERNWTGGGKDVVVADDDPRDAALVRDGLDGRGGDDGTLATRKDAALRKEAALLDGAPHAPALVETEYVGAGPLTRALREHAAAGGPTTLIVAEGAHSRPERKAIASLRRDGVRVLTHGAGVKLALVGDAAWIGSANGTSTFYTGKDGVRHTTGDQVDWGLVTQEPQLVDAVRAALTRDAAA